MQTEPNTDFHDQISIVVGEKSSVDVHRALIEFLVDGYIILRATEVKPSVILLTLGRK